MNEKIQGKTVSFAHLAKFRPVRKPTLMDRLAAAFLPGKSGLDEYMHKVGLMLAATYPYYGGQSGNNTNLGPVMGGYQVGVAEIPMNFASIAAARVAAGQAALASTDVLQLINLPVGIWVPAAFIQVTTAEGATATADLGDGAGTAGFISAANLNAVGWSSSLITSTYSLATAGGKIYTTADTIDLLLNHNAIDVAVCRVGAVLVDLRASR